MNRFKGKIRSTGTRPAIWCLAIVVSAAVSLGLGGKSEKEAKSTKKESEKSPSFTFRVPVEVVVVNAIAVDRQGNPVKDLTAADFRIYEDGRLQRIHTFALESYQASQIVDGEGRGSNGQPSVQPQEPGHSQPRFISLVIDDVTMGSLDVFPRAIEAMKNFVTTEMGPGDQIALVSASGRVQLPFTSDRGVLLEEMGGLFKKLNSSRPIKEQCPDLTDLQATIIHSNRPDPDRSLEVAVVETLACQGLASSPNGIQIAETRARQAAVQQHEETHYRIRTLLNTLRQHTRSLKHFEGKKSVILLSDGFLLEDVRYELQEVVDTALRSGVIVNTLDIRGLFTDNYQASDRVTFGTTPDQFQVLARKPLLRSADIRAQEEPLNQLAADTGGVFFHNSNDLFDGLRKISQTQSFYYVLTYASPASKADGRYHKIKLEVARPGLQVFHRKGYYAPKEQISFERRKKEDILEALHAPGNLNEIPMQLSFNYHQLDPSLYQVALLTKVNIRGLSFQEEDSRHRNLIHLVVVAFDENDRYVDGLEKAMELNLTDPSYVAMLNYGFTSKVDIKVPPGRYRIRAVVRESHHTKMGSTSKTIEVP